MKKLELSPKQCEFINKATHRYNGKIGATQCGKTFIDIAYVIPNRIFERRGEPGLYLILGVTKETIERNVLEPMRDFWGSQLIGEINSRNIAKLFGEKVYCLGAEKITQVTKLRGAKFKYAYCDELVDLNEQLFELLRSRLSLSYSVCDFTGNPSQPNHYVKRFIDSAADVYCQQWKIDDNPFLDPVRVAELKREYASTVYYNRYILGEWALAEGLIYGDVFNKDKVVVETVERRYEKYWISNDYGTQHPCVFQLWGLSDGVYYLIKEYYHKGSDGKQKTVEQYYNDLIKFIEGRKISLFIRDKAPIAASFNIYLKRKGNFPSRDCDNEVLAGIQTVATTLNQGRIKINNCAVKTINEFNMYSWDQKSTDDKPIKDNDDTMDCLRYFVQTVLSGKRNWVIG